MEANTAIQLKSQVTAIWQDNEKIRQLFAPTLTDKEFSFFVSLGMGLGANPFTREIWAVKYDKDKPASVFLGRDFYRKKAQEQEDYDGHVSEAVYEKDEFSVVDGTPKHSYQLLDRGKLIGAYAVLYRKGISHPYFVFVELTEYNKGFSNWKTMPATMIKKVAEAQALRGGYQGIFGDTYDESEQWEQARPTMKVLTPTQQQQPEPKAKTNGNGAGKDWTDHHKQKAEWIRERLLEMYGDGAAEELFTLTAFEGKGGHVAGKRSVSLLSGKQVDILFGKIEKLYEEYSVSEPPVAEENA